MNRMSQAGLRVGVLSEWLTLRGNTQTGSWSVDGGPFLRSLVESGVHDMRCVYGRCIQI